MASLSCKVDIPKVQGLKDEELTVGREFYLNCSGLMPKDLHLENLKIKDENGVQEKKSSDPMSGLKLKILDSQLRDSSTIDIKMTSYLVGEHRFSNLVLSDGSQEIELGPIEYKLASVLVPGNKPQKFGPIGPMPLGMSISYWILLATLGLAFVLILVTQIVKVRRRNKIKKELSLLEVPQTPIQQIYQTFRRLKRNYALFETGQGNIEDFEYLAKTIEEAFRVYFSRQFRVLALQWSDTQILKNFKKKFPQIYSLKKKEIQSLLREMAQIRDKKNQIQAQDIIQILKGTQRLVDTLEEMSQ